MSNLIVLNEIIKELERLERSVEDKYVLLAVQASLIQYKKELERERQSNALDVVRYKIKHLTDKLK